LYKLITYIFLVSLFIFSSSAFSQTEQKGQQKVLISLMLTDLEKIDTKSETFEAEFYLWLKWKEGGSGKNIEYMNATDYKNIFYDEWTDSLQRVSAKVRGTFRSSFDVEKYPFDKQVLKIRISDYDWNFDSLMYEVETSKIGIAKDVSDGEWDIKLIGATATKEYISEDNFSVFEFAIEIQRKSFSVFIKIIIPLFIIMAIAFLNLFVPRDQIEAGAGLAISTLLTIIALHFSISSQLPEVNYPTKVDILFIVSYFFNFLLVIWVVFGYNLYVGEKKNTIDKINKFVKPSLPLLYFIFAFVLLKWV
jgi:hypothetical protein